MNNYQTVESNTCPLVFTLHNRNESTFNKHQFGFGKNKVLIDSMKESNVCLGHVPTVESHLF